MSKSAELEQRGLDLAKRIHTQSIAQLQILVTEALAREVTIERNRRAPAEIDVMTAKHVPSVPVLERIEVLAQAGLCQMNHVGTREFLKDIRDLVADTLKQPRPQR